MPAQSLGARLRAARESRNPRVSRRALGEALGYEGASAYHTVWEWEHDQRGIRTDQLVAVAEMLGVTVAALLDHSDTPKPLATSNVERLIDVRRLEAADIPIYAWASLGPIDGEGAAEPVDWEPFPEDVEDLGARAIGVRVRGRSMANRGIEPGSTCYVDLDRAPRPGDVVLARAWNLDGSEAGMVVKVLANTGGHLESDGDDGRETFAVSRFDVIGPVVSLRPPSRRPVTARDSRRRRPDMRSRAQKLEAAIAAAQALSPAERRALAAELLKG